MMFDGEDTQMTPPTDTPEETAAPAEETPAGEENA
ncbi:MAG: hypothetical protein BWY14_00867 [Parcubacteria group bacterium ADurb.Bin192]|nr:MAG: hypothetical protein BWY14_00867 [Parcubacteria group bacterium ADurb.Bin192]